MTKKVYWLSAVGELDDFGGKIDHEVGGVIYDAPTKMGPWGLMNETSWRMFGATPQLGTGLGQKYQKQADGKWLKVEG